MLICRYYLARTRNQVCGFQFVPLNQCTNKGTKFVGSSSYHWISARTRNQVCGFQFVPLNQCTNKEPCLWVPVRTTESVHEQGTKSLGSNSYHWISARTWNQVFGLQFVALNPCTNRELSSWILVFIDILVNEQGIKFMGSKSDLLCLTRTRNLTYKTPVHNQICFKSPKITFNLF